MQILHHLQCDKLAVRGPECLCQLLIGDKNLLPVYHSTSADERLLPVIMGPVKMRLSEQHSWH